MLKLHATTASLLAALQVDDLCLCELEQAVLAVGAADAGFAPAGVVALHGFEMFTVYVGLAELQLIDRVHRFVQVLGKDRRGEPVFGVIGHGQCFVELVVNHDGCHGAEDFLAHDVHVL